MSSVDTTDTNVLALLTSLLSIALSNDRTADQNNVIGNFFMAVGSIILTIAAQQAMTQTKQDNEQQTKYIQQQFNLLNGQLEQILKI